MAINPNVSNFFRLYDSDPALRKRLKDAEDMYPGSLEIREAVCEDILLPVAEELGFPFSLADLKAYESKVKMKHEASDIQQDTTDEGPVFWLIDHGWENNEARFCGDE